MAISYFRFRFCHHLKYCRHLKFLKIGPKFVSENTIKQLSALPSSEIPFRYISNPMNRTIVSQNRKQKTNKKNLRIMTKISSNYRYLLYVESFVFECDQYQTMAWCRCVQKFYFFDSLEIDSEGFGFSSICARQKKITK